MSAPRSVPRPPAVRRVAARGFLFDMDGTLVASGGAVSRCWQRWSAEYDVSAAALAATDPAGRPAVATVRALLPAAVVPAALARYEQLECEDLDGVVTLPGVHALLADLPRDRWAVVTSATRPVAEARLRAAGIDAPVLVTADEVPHGKPAPDPYVLAASRLGLPTRDCAAFEDAAAGLRSARAAGALAVAVVGDTPADDADLVVDGLHAVRLRPLAVGTAHVEPVATTVAVTTPVARVGYVMPYYDTGDPEQRRAFTAALASLRAQSDPTWSLHVVDDCSPAPDAAERLRAATQGDHRITLHRTTANAGAGGARNVGVRAVDRAGLDVVAYLDADDLAHPDRTAVLARRFGADPGLDLVYGDIDFVDEHGRSRSRHELSPTLQLIHDQQRLPALRGREQWREHALARDCLAIPSTLALRTRLALAHPFPAVRYCEDVATLLRYLGTGCRIDHAEGITAGYRVPSARSSASRDRCGSLETFNRARCVNEFEALQEVVAGATARGVCSPEEGRSVLHGYLRRIAATVAAEGCADLAAEQLALARAFAPPADTRRTARPVRQPVAA